MNLISIGISSLSLVGLVLAGLLFRAHLSSYVAEKGKNLASKEDLAHLTEVVESVKTLHTSELERLKAELHTESELTERRRRVYEEICLALRVFISGHGGTLEMKERFHAAYAAAWLWASDGVLIALNHFVALQIQHTNTPSSIDQSTLKNAYRAVVVEMRKDVGFGSTVASGNEYQFVKF